MSAGTASSLAPQTSGPRAGVVQIVSPDLWWWIALGMSGGLVVLLSQLLLFAWYCDYKKQYLRPLAAAHGAEDGEEEKGASPLSNRRGSVDAEADFYQNTEATQRGTRGDDATGTTTDEELRGRGTRGPRPGGGNAVGHYTNTAAPSWAPHPLVPPSQRGRSPLTQQAEPDSSRDSPSIGPLPLGRAASSTDAVEPPSTAAPHGAAHGSVRGPPARETSSNQRPPLPRPRRASVPTVTVKAVAGDAGAAVPLVGAKVEEGIRRTASVGSCSGSRAVSAPAPTGDHTSTPAISSPLPTQQHLNTTTTAPAAATTTTSASSSRRRVELFSAMPKAAPPSPPIARAATPSALPSSVRDADATATKTQAGGRLASAPVLYRDGVPQFYFGGKARGASRSRQDGATAQRGAAATPPPVLPAPLPQRQADRSPSVPIDAQRATVSSANVPTRHLSQRRSSLTPLGDHSRRSSGSPSRSNTPVATDSSVSFQRGGSPVREAADAHSRSGRKATRISAQSRSASAAPSATAVEPPLLLPQGREAVVAAIQSFPTSEHQKITSGVALPLQTPAAGLAHRTGAVAQQKLCLGSEPPAAKTARRPGSATAGPNTSAAFASTASPLARPMGGSGASRSGLPLSPPLSYAIPPVPSSPPATQLQPATPSTDAAPESPQNERSSLNSLASTAAPHGPSSKPPPSMQRSPTMGGGRQLSGEYSPDISALPSPADGRAGSSAEALQCSSVGFTSPPVRPLTARLSASYSPGGPPQLVPTIDMVQRSPSIAPAPVPAAAAGRLGSLSLTTAPPHYPDDGGDASFSCSSDADTVPAGVIPPVNRETIQLSVQAALPSPRGARRGEAAGGIQVLRITQPDGRLLPPPHSGSMPGVIYASREGFEIPYPALFGQYTPSSSSTAATTLSSYVAPSAASNPSSNAVVEKSLPRPSSDVVGLQYVSHAENRRERGAATKTIAVVKKNSNSSKVMPTMPPSSSKRRFAEYNHVGALGGGGGAGLPRRTSSQPPPEVMSWNPSAYGESAGASGRYTNINQPRN